jgi:hypothetical protein
MPKTLRFPQAREHARRSANTEGGAMSTDAPAGLGENGRALWASLVGDVAEGWELDARELHLLERACRVADEIALLEQAVDRDGATVAGSRAQIVVHPALQEARQLRLVELRLLRAIDLGGNEDEETPARRRARHAAEARWGTPHQPRRRARRDPHPRGRVRWDAGSAPARPRPR